MILDAFKIVNISLREDIPISVLLVQQAKKLYYEAFFAFANVVRNRAELR